MAFEDIKLKLSENLFGIMATWNSSTIVGKVIEGYVLMRKRYAYPTSVIDGVEVHNGDETVLEFLDNTVVNGELYYYTLFVLTNDGEFTSSGNLIGHMRALLQNSWGDSLYRQLPALYRNEDEKLYDIDSDLAKPLYRFLKIFGYQFDKLATLVDKMIENIDIDECDVDLLKAYADYFDAIYNGEIPVKENRKVITSVLESVNQKGTKKTLEYLLQNISKANVNITFPTYDVLKTDSVEAIRARRTVSVNIDADPEKLFWIFERKQDVESIIERYLPLGYESDLRVVLSYIDTYLNTIKEQSWSDTFKEKNWKHVRGGINVGSLRGFTENDMIRDSTWGTIVIIETINH